MTHSFDEKISQISIIDGSRPVLFMTEKEYNDMVHQSADSLYRFVLKTLGQEADAQDMVQAAFEVMWKNRLQIDPATAKSYLFRVGFNKMMDHFRLKKRTDLHEAPEQLEHGVSQQRDNSLKEALDIALGRLSEQSRSLVLLKDYEGYSYEEIGQITGLNSSQVKVYLHRARLQLRSYLVKMEHLV
ncbi:RNA polymerase sigma factor [Niabella terrae]